VKAGDVLGEVASLELQNMQLEMLRSHLQLGLLEQVHSRLKELAKSGAVPERRLWETEIAARSARQKRDTLRNKLEGLGLSAGQVEGMLEKQAFVPNLPLRSPIDGVVVRFRGTLGQAVKAEDPLFEIHDLAHVWVQGYVSEQGVAAVKIGQAAR